MAGKITNHTIFAAAAAALFLSSAPAQADELPIEFGAFGGYHIFSDKNELGAFDENSAVTVDDSLIFGLRAAYFLLPRLALEAEVGILPAETEGSATDVLALVWRANGLLHLFGPEKATRPFLLAGLGAMSGRPDDQAVNRDDTDLVLHAGVGVKQHIASGWGLRADARLVFPPSTGNEFVTTEAEFLLGIYKAFNQPEKAPPFVPLDSDGDGFLDPEDGCPEDAEDPDGFEDSDGCPDLDNDKDGILDDADGCPLEAEDIDQFEDTDGCPEADNDQDGLDDNVDQCPNEAEDKDGFEDEDGCPETDNDQDGIVDGDDKCPLEPETKNGFEDADGCPDEVPAAVVKFTGTIKGIAFQTGSDTIRPSSHQVLDQAVAVLSEYPDVKLEIQGHTDDVGGDAYNLELSEKRAASVKTYFVSKGIAEDRLITKGFGETQPEVENTSRANRSKNRRVVFLLVQ